MTVESVTYIDDLDDTYPTGGDPKSEGDNHIRNIKTGITASFPNITGAMTATHTELNTLDGITSTTAELNILDGVTATAAELNYLDIAALGTGATTKAVVVDGSGNYTWPVGGTLTYDTLHDGTTALTATVAELNALDGITATVAELNILDGVTSTAAELNILDGVTSTAAELNVLDGIPGTLTATELGYVDGVTSAIQTQIDTKAPSASPALTGTPTAPTAAGGSSGTQIANLDFVNNAVLSGSLPGQAGNAGKYLKTNGSTATWEIVDLDTPNANIAINAFRIQTNGGLSVLNMVDGVTDSFEDTTGISLGSVSNASYTTTASPTGGYFSDDTANIGFVTVDATALSAPDRIFAVLWAEDVDAATENTDFEVWVSRENPVTVTTDWATNDKFSAVGHGFSNGERVIITANDAGGFLPSGCDTTQAYYVVNAGANDFELSLTSGGAAITLTSDGYGPGLASASYVDEFSVGTQETSPQGMAFSSDGTKMFVIGTSGDDINEYTLSTAWDVSTAAVEGSPFSVSGDTTSPLAIGFKSDGTAYWVAGSDNLYHYTCTAWDISTSSAGTDDLLTVTEITGNIGLILFNNDGSKMYLWDTGSEALYQYTLSPAWDVSSASYDSKSLSSAVVNNYRGAAFIDSGRRLVLNDDSGGSFALATYDLSTAYDISTATLTANVPMFVPSDTTGNRGLVFSADESKFFILDNTNNDVTEYTNGARQVKQITLAEEAVIGSDQILTGSVDASTLDSGTTIMAAVNTSNTKEVKFKAIAVEWS
jgi:sugar lactone lactonase YvrE